MSGPGALRGIHLYHEGTASTLRIAEIASYLSEQTGCQHLHVRGSFLLEHTTEAQFAEIARRLAGLKVMDVNSPWREREATHGEAEFERRRLAKGDQGPHGLVYEGFGLQVLMRELMAAGPGSPALHTAHIAFTNRLVATWGDDLRYHLRTIILGIPAIISTTGLVEAPAKPREFYLAQRNLGAVGLPVQGQSEYALSRLKEQFKGRFLDYDDPRLTEVAKGYAMQAIAYQLAGEAFCEDPECRLFNAHWQEEMLEAQTAARQHRYCNRHEMMLAAWRGERRRVRGER